MQLDININHEMYPELYYRFAVFVFNNMKDDIYSLSYRKAPNYDVRKRLLMKSQMIEERVLKSLDLVDCINNAIELVSISGIYVIRLNSTERIRGSNLKLKQLVKLLEFGTLTFPELPVLRRIFRQYQDEYQELFNDFIEEEFS